MLRADVSAVPAEELRDERETAQRALQLGYQVWGMDQELIGSPRRLLREVVSLAEDEGPAEPRGGDAEAGTCDVD